GRAAGRAGRGPTAPAAAPGPRRPAGTEPYHRGAAHRGVDTQRRGEHRRPDPPGAAARAAVVGTAQHRVHRARTDPGGLRRVDRAMCAPERGRGDRPDTPRRGGAAARGWGRTAAAAAAPLAPTVQAGTGPGGGAAWPVRDQRRVGHSAAAGTRGRGVPPPGGRRGGDRIRRAGLLGGGVRARTGRSRDPRATAADGTPRCPPDRLGPSRWARPAARGPGRDRPENRSLRQTTPGASAENTGRETLVTYRWARSAGRPCACTVGPGETASGTRVEWPPKAARLA